MVHMEELKVWWVVAWDTYYPSGSLRNVKGTFYTEEGAKAFTEELEAQGRFDNVEIVNVSDYLE
jgi:hypothetical protein